MLVIGIVIGLSVNVSAEEDIIPSWIKTTAGFWVNDQIGDSEFIQALQYLITNGILEVPTPTSEIDKELAEVDKELELRMKQRLLECADNPELCGNKSGDSPPPVEMGFNCYSSFAMNGNPGDTEFVVDVTNFDSIKHSATITVTDETEGGNVLSSETNTIELEPGETKNWTTTLDKTSLSGPFCTVYLDKVD